MDAGMIGRAALFLGAGRAQAHDAIDFAVGFSQIKKVGENVAQHEPLLAIHARGGHDLASVLPMVEEAVVIA